MRLTSEIIVPTLLTETDVQSMFGLMRSYFDAVSLDLFSKDLFEKNWVIMIRDKDNSKICGFSTISLLTDNINGAKITVVYSGDTILKKECWQAFSLERAWVPFVFSKVRSDPDRLWYWFLISKGYRTYRYLPLHFKQFWPSPDEAIPSFERNLLNRLGNKKFDHFYDPHNNIIKFPNDYRLKQGVSDITPQKRKDRYVEFFVKSNPGWNQGDELACIVPLRFSNIKPSLQRIFKSRLVSSS